MPNEHIESPLQAKASTFNDRMETFDSDNIPMAPYPGFAIPRKLDFSDHVIDNNKIEVARIRTPLRSPIIGVTPGSMSPPYKKVRALRLFDTPTTPKTIIEKSSTPMSDLKSRNHLMHRMTCFNANTTLDNKHLNPAANFNPFTPENVKNKSNKRTRSSMKRAHLLQSKLVNKNENEILDEWTDDTDSDSENEKPTKRLALQDSNISRYHEEFLELELIGAGEFGSVYKCINRLDGCIYAVKKSLKPVAGSYYEKTALNEVYAHAVLGKHQHVVRYYSAWAENDHMIIQNEYCNGGSLADALLKHERDGTRFSESELRRLLHHLAEGLRYIHSMNLVHLDIKPANIFITKEARAHALCYDSADDGFDDCDETSEQLIEELTYKIGDLGHVTSTSSPQVEEGDSRYLPLELLRDDVSNLPKADIFSLGLTMYEAAGSGPLPKNGDEWHKIREGKLKELPYSKEFSQLLKQMIDMKAENRPSATNILQHRYLCPSGNKSKAQLRRELNAVKLKNELLAQQLMEAAKCLKTFAPTRMVSVTSNPVCTRQLRSSTQRRNDMNVSKVGQAKSSRAIGKSVNRSLSTTDF